MAVLENVACSITASIIYDIVKLIVSKINLKKKSDNHYKEIINKMEIPDKFIMLIETGINERILNTPTIGDMIYSYTLYQVGVSPNNKGNVKQLIKNDQDLAYEIAKKIYLSYIEEESLTTISINQIKEYIIFLAQSVKRLVFEELDDTSKIEVFYINSYLSFLYQETKKELSNLHILLKKGSQYENNSPDYIKAKDNYYSILKSRFSEAHIYLLDKFQFNRFYVSPYLLNASEKYAAKDYYFETIERYIPAQSKHQYFSTLSEKEIDVSKKYISIQNKENYIIRKNPFEKKEDGWKYIFDNNNIIYVTGGAGYGKSLFLQKLINDYLGLNIYRASEYLVIYGELKSFYPNNSDTPISVESFLQNSMKNCTLLDEATISADLIRHYLSMGRCIILFDALDEVEKEKREVLHQTLISFLKNQNPNNKICITSRDRGFIPEKDIEVFSIQPLDERQIEKYVDNIIKLGKFEKDSKDKFMQQTKVLIDKGFLNSFLVLSLLVNIYKSENELPENKLELYQKCFEYIANKREKIKTVDRYDWKIISPLMKDNTFMELSELCFPNNTPVDKSIIIDKLMITYKTKFDNEVDTENAIEDFLRFCSDRTELFVPAQGENKFKFFHRSFFEYFYSQYIFVRFNDENEILNKLMKFDVDSEVFELTVAMLKQKAEEKYQRLIELIMDRAVKELENDDVQLNAFNILTLSMQAVDDIAYLNRFINILLKYKDTISKNASIQNDRIIADIVKSNQDYVNAICKEYYCEAMIFLFKLLLTNNHVVFLDMIREHQLFNHIGLQDFYTMVFFENHDVHDLLVGLNSTEIDEIIRYSIHFNKFSNKKIKSLKKIIKNYKLLSSNETESKDDSVKKHS